MFRFKAKGTAYKRHNHQLPLEESLSYFLLEGYSLSAPPTSPPHTCDSKWSGQLLKGRNQNSDIAWEETQLPPSPSGSVEGQGQWPSYSWQTRVLQ